MNMYFSATELFLKLTQLNQDNYPERMKALYIINGNILIYFSSNLCIICACVCSIYTHSFIFLQHQPISP